MGNLSAAQQAELIQALQELPEDKVQEVLDFTAEIEQMREMDLEEYDGGLVSWSITGRRASLR